MERLEIASSDRDFDALAAAWTELARGASPFMSWHWHRAWLDAFAAGGEPRVFTIRRDERLVAVLPLVERAGALAAMANDHTPDFCPLAADGRALTAVVAAALKAAGGTLTVPALPAGDPLTAVHAARWRILSTEDFVSPAVETTGSFADWRDGSKPRWGAPIERFRRKMQRDHQARFTTVEAPDHLGETLDAGFAVEASGWKGRAGTAILSSEHTATFYRRVAEEFAARDGLRVSTIELDGEMAAFDLYVRDAGRLYLLKTGYDERFRRLAPGLVTQLNTIERCFQTDVASYELLGDRSEWKAKFATTERPHVHSTLYSRAPSGTGRYAYRRTGRAVKRALRSARHRLATQRA